MDEDQLLNRALSAYWATAAREQYSAAIPSTSGSGLYEVGDKDYVALRNGGGVLAVYRVRTDGMLKRLRRWPADLGTTEGGACGDEWRRDRGR